MNEFILGALDLSPYIVSVHHRNYKTFWVKLDKYAPDSKWVYAELKEIYLASRYTLPLSITYDNRTYGFKVALDWVDMQSITFTVRAGKDRDYMRLIAMGRLQFSENALPTRIMA